ncbi:hypothetical protein BX285_1525 [Streptomyces sp. 1114.5]|nr:hypothetical protein BX285_1525 [Streptomyces sp. 1114.5]
MSHSLAAPPGTVQHLFRRIHNTLLSIALSIRVVDPRC